MGDRDRNRFRWAWWLLAYASLGVGIVGIFVPGLPTTVFVIAAAWAGIWLGTRPAASARVGWSVGCWPIRTSAR